MKINTITCHDVYNYGASLQAYALQRYLEKQGHVVEIINYLPPYIKHIPKFWEVREGSRFASKVRYNPLFRLLYSLVILFRYRKWKKRRVAFDTFTKSYLHLTKEYKSVEELRLEPPSGECYVSGSDQVWNSYLNNGKDGAFFLDFGDKKKKRIAYACSFGANTIAPGFEKFTKEKLSIFDAISIREYSGIEIVKKLGFEAKHVSDPVFLLERKDWEEIANFSRIKVSDKYILIYQIYQNNPLMQEWIKKIKLKTELKVVAIKTTFKVSFADKNIEDAGPIEFLYLVQNASVVVSDSFHATAFSTIFNVPFLVTISDKVSSVSRLVDFCKSVDCLKLFNPPISSDCGVQIDWEKVNQKLSKNSLVSKDFLKNNIEFK